MNTLGMIIVCTLATIANSDFSQANGWRGIVPLHSTRAEVERLLGAPKESRGVASTYETKDERVNVFYSDGLCEKDRSEDWNVPRDTVVRITVHPNTKLLVNDLQIDKAKYERRRDPHLEGVVYYINTMEGVFIDARKLEGGGEDVDNISYGPAVTDNHLRCFGHLSGSNQDDTIEGVGDGHIRKFDEYSDLSSEDEKAHLDNFAIYLQKDEPQFKGYIIVYAGQNTRSGETQAHAKRARDYLVKVRGVEAARIVTIDGGCRDRLEVELYALPSSMSPPTPNPYRNK